MILSARFGSSGTDARWRMAGEATGIDSQVECAAYDTRAGGADTENTMPLEGEAVEANVLAANLS